MKRWTALLLCLALLCGFAAAEAVDVTGVWYLIAMEYQGVSMNPADMGMEMNISLNADGTGTASMTSGGDLEAAWVLEGTALTVTANEEPIVFEVAEDGTLVGEDGSGVRMVMGREAPVPSFVPPAEVAATELAQFNGSWVATMVDVYGVTVAFEGLASMGLTDGSVVIEDGKVVKFGEEETETGALVDGVLVVDSGTENDEDNVFGATVALLEDGTIKVVYLGIVFYCERVE